MTERFKKLYDEVLKWEGGDKLHNVSGDSGGWTKYGIAYNYNKQHFKSLEEFKKMSYDKAAEITFQNYYKPLNLDIVNPESQAMLFDIAFNMGVKRAIILAQRALGLEDDGISGKNTKSKLPSLNKVKLYQERVKYYNAIVKNNPTQKKFLKGWLRRAESYLNSEL